MERILFRKLELASGDTIIAPKSEWQMVQHYALYLGQDNYGRHYLCENVFGVGVKLTRLKDFFKEYKKVTKVQKFIGSNTKREAIIKRALSKLGQRYDLINYNCEHYVNDVILRKPTSKQVSNAFGLLIIAVLIGMLNKD